VLDDREFQVLVLGHRPECLLQVVVDLGEVDAGGLDVHPPGLDLGKIEYVVDESQEVLSR
jgi:hypothetical protein